jgi:hypothetical protein
VLGTQIEKQLLRYSTDMIAQIGDEVRAHACAFGCREFDMQLYLNLDYIYNWRGGARGGKRMYACLLVSRFSECLGSWVCVGWVWEWFVAQADPKP